MLNQMEFRVTTGLSVLALVLVVVNAYLIQDNRTKQVDLSQRSQYIQQSLQLETIYQALVRSLAEAAGNGDRLIGSLLNGQGITVTAPQHKDKEAGK